MSTLHKAKVTIELEDGTKLEFVAALEVERVPDPGYHPDKPYGVFGGEWNTKFISRPPKWGFRGSTLDGIVVTVP